MRPVLLSLLASAMIAACATTATGGLQLAGKSESGAKAAPAAAGSLIKDVCVPNLKGEPFGEVVTNADVIKVKNPARNMRGGFPDDAYVKSNSPRVYVWDFGSTYIIGTPKLGCTLGVFEGNPQAALDSIEDELRLSYTNETSLTLPSANELSSRPIYIRGKDTPLWIVISSDEAKTADGRLLRAAQGFLISIYTDAEDKT